MLRLETIVVGEGQSGQLSESWLALEAYTKRDRENAQHVAYLSLSLSLIRFSKRKHKIRRNSNFSITLCLLLIYTYGDVRRQR